MAGNFNLTDYKNNNYLNNLYDPTKLYAAAAKNMEEKETEKAEEVVKKSFGSLTLSEKLLELGVGKRVLEQIGDTAFGVVRDIVDPVVDYLKQNEIAYTPDMYDSEMMSYVNQMEQASAAMREDSQSRTTGQQYTMLV